MSEEWRIRPGDLVTSQPRPDDVSTVELWDSEGRVWVDRIYAGEGALVLSIGNAIMGHPDVCVLSPRGKIGWAWRSTVWKIKDVESVSERSPVVR